MLCMNLQKRSTLQIITVLKQTETCEQTLDDHTITVNKLNNQEPYEENMDESNVRVTLNKQKSFSFLLYLGFISVMFAITIQSSTVPPMTSDYNIALPFSDCVAIPGPSMIMKEEIVFQAEATDGVFVYMDAQGCPTGTPTFSYSLLFPGSGGSRAFFRRINTATLPAVQSYFKPFLRTPEWYWITWHEHVIQAGIGNITGRNILTTYFDPTPLPITKIYFGTFTTEAVKYTVPLSYWTTENTTDAPMPTTDILSLSCATSTDEQFTTTDNIFYDPGVSLTSHNYIILQVQGKLSASVCLSSYNNNGSDLGCGSLDPAYGINFHNKSASGMAADLELFFPGGSNLIITPRPILVSSSYQWIWISWTARMITVGLGQDPTDWTKTLAIMDEPNLLMPINYISFSSYLATTTGNSVQWILPSCYATPAYG